MENINHAFYNGNLIETWQYADKQWGYTIYNSYKDEVAEDEEGHKTKEEAISNAEGRIDSMLDRQLERGHA